jgi:hypothetical protein
MIAITAIAAESMNSAAKISAMSLAEFFFIGYHLSRVFSVL